MEAEGDKQRLPDDIEMRQASLAIVGQYYLVPGGGGFLRKITPPDRRRQTRLFAPQSGRAATNPAPRGVRLWRAMPLFQAASADLAPLCRHACKDAGMARRRRTPRSTGGASPRNRRKLRRTQQGVIHGTRVFMGFGGPPRPMGTRSRSRRGNDSGWVEPKHFLPLVFRAA